ncbi:MAG TPA: DUF4139 domain-containing protein [Stellaceae bacterium]|jgi:uncharacterized protein (TIGR02231 family)|nr:DUF4139 domain-containing protein [Stellaceae bacterium]
MTKRQVIAPALIATLAAPGLALATEPASLDITTAPVEVTIYDSQATVLRQGEVEIPAGESIVVLHGLPAEIVEDSVTVKGTSAGKVVIGSIDTRAQLVAEAVNRKRAELDAAIREIDDKIGLVDVRLAAFDAEKDFIAALSRLPQTPEQAPAPSWSNSETWKSAWNTVHDGVLDAETNINTARHDRRQLEEERARLAARADGLGADAKRMLEIAIPVTSDKPARLGLSVSYQVPHAAWRPIYDLRLDTTSGKVTVLQQATIMQSTGEDWSNVALKLSTAKPARGIAPPTLEPLRVALADLAQYRSRTRALAGKDDSDGLQRLILRAPAASTAAPAPAEAKTEAEPEPVPIAEAETIAAGLSVEFAVPGVVSVPSDPSQHKVRIGENSWDATFFARTVPRVDSNAYLHARFKNGTAAAFLPGVAAAYVDGVYVGRENLPLARPGEEITAAFGPDDRIRVKFEPQVEKTSVETAIIGKNKQVVERSFLTTVKSFHTRPLVVTVLDRIPVSGDETLKVEVTTTPEPAAKNVDDKPGLIAWSQEYKPGDEAQFSLRYLLTAPQEKVITGF